jgi:hypothetical protein
MGRPLDGVEAKIALARVHLEALHRAAGRLFAEQPIRIDLLPDRQEGWFLVRPDFVAEPPLSLGVGIGDVVHNLRSALDHLVWQLSLVQTAKPSRQTQFPIADNASAFRDQCFRIAWLPPDQQAMIESVQPYNRGGPASNLRLLRELSNADKHRVLTPVLNVPSAVDVDFEGDNCEVHDVQWLGGNRLRGGTDMARLRLSGQLADPHVRMRGTVVPDVVFEDGWSVLVGLMGIGAEVVRIVEEFEPILEPQEIPIPFMFQRRPWAQLNTLP